MGSISMSLEVELHKKAGKVCPQAANGEIRCPLIVRQTSEDVVTGTVFGILRHIRPHLWLGPLLNEAFQTTTFQQVWYKELSLRFWERQSRFPPELLDFREGKSEIDLIIEWENKPTTIWVEAKLLSELATGTTHSCDNDQVARGVRTLLAATGHIQPNRLFHQTKRRPLWLALLAEKPHDLVERYRQGMAIGGICTEPAPAPPPAEMIGTITWSDIREVVTTHRRLMNPTEYDMSKRLTQYLDLKLHELKEQRDLSKRTVSLPLLSGM